MEKVQQLFSKAQVILGETSSEFDKLSALMGVNRKNVSLEDVVTFVELWVEQISRKSMHIP